MRVGAREPNPRCGLSCFALSQNGGASFRTCLGGGGIVLGCTLMCVLRASVAGAKYVRASSLRASVAGAKYVRASSLRASVAGAKYVRASSEYFGGDCPHWLNRFRVGVACSRA